MTRSITAFFALTILIGSAGVSTAAEDSFTCSLTRAYECSGDQGCKAWSMEEMALPNFVRIDLKAKTITSLDKNVAQTSKIAVIERLEGLIIMHGTEMRGWSMALGEESGDVTLTGAGDGEGFIVFGKCLNKSEQH
jgi:hypothetical protein